MDRSRWLMGSEARLDGSNHDRFQPRSDTHDRIADPHRGCERFGGHCRNGRVVTGGLGAGFPSESPYDLILLEGAVEFVPDGLFDQLGEGGRLVAVTGAGGSAIAALYTKTAGDIGRRPAFNVTVRPLPGF